MAFQMINCNFDKSGYVRPCHLAQLQHDAGDSVLQLLSRRVHKQSRHAFGAGHGAAPAIPKTEPPPDQTEPDVDRTRTQDGVRQ